MYLLLSLQAPFLVPNEKKYWPQERRHYLDPGPDYAYTGKKMGAARVRRGP